MDTVESDDEDTEIVRKSNRLVTSQQSLAAAKNLVTNLESQVTAAKCLVNTLEMNVQNIKRELEQYQMKKNRRKTNNQTFSKNVMSNVMLTPCSVCLEVPSPPLK